MVFTLDEAAALVVEIQEGRICAEELVFFEGHIAEINQFVIVQNELCEEAIEQARPSFLEKLKNGILLYGGGIITGILIVGVL